MELEPTECTNFLNIFFIFLYMFRVNCVPIIRKNTVPMRHVLLVNLYRWLSGMQEVIPPCILCVRAHYMYGIFSWWLALSCPKHVEKSNKHIKKIFAPSWFYLQDYTRMYSQQNIKCLCLFVRIKICWVVNIYFRNTNANWGSKIKFPRNIWMLRNGV